MSGWHRDNPELIGTEADPCYDSPGYMTSLHEVQEIERENAFERRHGKSLDSMIAEAEESRDSAMCECGHRYDQHDPDPPGGGYCEVVGCDCESHEEG